MKLLTLAHLTLLELWRRKTLLGPLVVMGLLGLLALIPADQLMVPGLPMTGGVAAASLVWGVHFVAVYLTVVTVGDLISQDVSRGTMLLVASKPMSRPMVLLGKGLGGACFMGAAWLAWGLVAGAGVGSKFGWDHFGPTLLLFAASSVTSLMLIALCLFLSCLTTGKPLQIIALQAWLMTAMATLFEKVAEQSGNVLAVQGVKVVSWLLPVERYLKACLDLLNHKPPAIEALWSVGVLAAWLALAVVVFSRKDLNPQD